MRDRFGRDTSHLRDSHGERPPEFATDCIAAVEDLFGKAWLEGQEGQDGHRLQKLWKRKDWLATCEFFGLGNAITTLMPKQRVWLGQTAKKIKSGIKNAHGFITEILICGSIKVRSGKVYPAAGNQKGFDFVIEFQSGFKYYISIKSQGMALHESIFHDLGDCLNKAFVQRLGDLGVNGEPYLQSAVHIEPEVFEFFIDFVSSKLKTFKEYTYKECKLVFRKLPRAKKAYASSFRSSQVVIHCPPHRNALKNAKDKLIGAAQNMGARLPCSDKYFRYLWIRVHSSTEVAALEAVARSMLEDDSRDYGFDGVHFLQTSVIREGSGSLINTYFGHVAAELHQGFNRAVLAGDVSLITMAAPVGGLSMKPSELHVANGLVSAQMPSDHYVYQKSDVYFLMEREGEAMVGNVSSPASGIHHHLVYNTGLSEVLLSLTSAEVEETLII